MALILNSCSTKENSDQYEAFEVTQNQAIITDVIPNKRTVAVDWKVSALLKNTSKDAKWFIIADSFDDIPLKNGIKASGYSYYQGNDFTKVPEVSLFGSDSFELLLIPAGAAVSLENIKIRQHNTQLPKELVVWQAHGINVNGKSIHDTWLLGLNVFTPPRKTSLNMDNRQQLKEFNNAGYAEQTLTFEDLQINHIQLKLANIHLPKFVTQ